jgi:hypothetical protein
MSDAQHAQGNLSSDRIRRATFAACYWFFFQIRYPFGARPFWLGQSELETRLSRTVFLDTA